MLYHYRQHSGAEVDLVIEKDGLLYPIEIKAASNVRPSDCQSIDIFREKMGERVQPGLIISGCKEVFRVGKRCVAIPFDLV